ncbi:hypothetical protein BE08_38340 [Sorangium cellulosum]|uniref:Uncharacterized protein n=1 Tax=Sorangium cellulosum TaxID=56 RepID=A0A150PKP4_SORCE|nr:hypothetical protein BE08_38340 [Sorangium cellulosum]
MADPVRATRMPTSASRRARSAMRDSDASSSSRAGCFTRRRARTRVVGRTKPSLTDTRTVPATVASLASRRSASRPSSMFSPSPTSASASASTWTPALPRCTSVRPRARSSASTRRATVDVATPSALPAARKLFSR